MKNFTYNITTSESTKYGSIVKAVVEYNEEEPKRSTGHFLLSSGLSDNVLPELLDWNMVDAETAEEDIREELYNYLSEEGEIDVKVEAEFDVIALIEEKRTDLAEAICEAYQTDSSYNTDVILEKDGTIRSHNYFGSIDYRDNDIAYIFQVSNSNKVDDKIGLQEGLTQAQLDLVLERGWATIWETNSDDPADWEEYEPTWDDYVEIVDRKIEELKSDTV